MPPSSQSLYFHLGMRADDDGIVEAFQVMKLTGANEDDLKVLVAKGFIKILNEDLVSFILDWIEHNFIRADRKIDSIYKDLLIQILPEIKLIEPKPRADTGKPTGQPMDVHSPHRLGKVRLGKDNIYNILPPSAEKNMRIIESEDPTDLKIIDLDGDEESIDPVKQKVKQVKGYDPAWTNNLLKWAVKEKREGKNFTHPLKQKAHISAMLAAGWTPDQIKTKWDTLEGEYWGGRGIDFAIVANEMDKTESTPQIVKI